MTEILFPDSRILKALGGSQEQELVERRMISGVRKHVRLMVEGAGLWETDDKEDWDGVFNHLCLDANLSTAIAERLQKLARNAEFRSHLSATDRESYLPELDNSQFLQHVMNASWMHDIAKRLDEEDEHRVRREGGDYVDFHDMLAYDLAEELGLPEEVCNACRSHHFPTSLDHFKLIDKIILCADLMSGQKYMTPQERFADIRKRWIEDRIADGKAPRIDPRRFEKFKDVGMQVCSEMVQLLGFSDANELVRFIEKQGMREELRLMQLARVKGGEQQLTKAVEEIEKGRKYTVDQLRSITLKEDNDIIPS